MSELKSSNTSSAGVASQSASAGRQAPSSTPGSKRQPTLARQHIEPLHPGGWPIYRNRRGRPRWYQRWLEAWWALTNEMSLHRAWQNGYDQHIRDESMRRSRGGQ